MECNHSFAFSRVFSSGLPHFRQTGCFLSSRHLSGFNTYSNVPLVGLLSALHYKTMILLLMVPTPSNTLYRFFDSCFFWNLRLQCVLRGVRNKTLDIKSDKIRLALSKIAENYLLSPLQLSYWRFFNVLYFSSIAALLLQDKMFLHFFKIVYTRHRSVDW